MIRRNGLPTTILLTLLLLTPGAPLHGQEQQVVQLSIEGAIGPATEDYVVRSLQRIAGEPVALVILRMDTPGGLDSAMRGIIKAITNANLPIASYVAPTGARAASAGTYILYASHIAAMAPGTNLGAATPVSIGGGMPGGEQPPGKEEEKKPPAGQSTSERKAVNDAVAYIRGLAQLHGRNIEWAEKAVREAASLPAEEALAMKVIDLIADDTSDLLRQLDGREVIINGHPRKLMTAGTTVTEIVPDWRSRLLSVITNPNVAYILMLLGIYGLIFEFTNPGALIPGTVGAIALLLALYAFQLLPVNYAGVALILLGVALMVAEAFAPSFGMLGIGGVIAFVIGSIILIDTDSPGFGIDLSVIVSFTLASLLLFVFVIGMALKARQRPVVSGLEQMLGDEGVVVSDFDGKGNIAIHGEHWTALSSSPLLKGQRVRVIGIDGLTLEVEPTRRSIEEKSS